jgi:pimeloyl-ACP methyl ester carboxylesterase
MKTETVKITAGNVRLEGTLTWPDGAERGMAIFVHGSGPLDRDSNTRGAPLNIFNTLAAALAQVGIASIRYDKRGCGASTGRYLEAGQADLVDDLCGWITKARSLTQAPIHLCGHSEGTALAAMAAEREEVSGLILMCPYVTPGDEILRWQAGQAHAMVRDMPGLKGRVARVAGRIVGTPLQMQERLITKAQANTSGTFRLMGQKVPARWLRDFMEADVRELQLRQTLPTLVLVAAEDVQCPPEDGAVIAGSNPNAELQVIDRLSHLLRRTEAPGLLDYPRQLKAPMDDRVPKAVAAWLDKQSPPV